MEDQLINEIISLSIFIVDGAYDFLKNIYK